MNYLRKRRKRAGLTQDELARRSGVQRTQITNMERGVRKMNSRTAEMLADELGTDAYQLVMQDRVEKINKAMDEKDAKKVLRLGSELIDLARAGDETTEEEIAEVEDELLKFVRRVAPDLVDEDDEEDEDDEPRRKKPGSKKRRSRNSDRDDEDEDIERDAFGVRLNKDLDGDDLDTGEHSEEDDLDDFAPGRDAMGRKIDKEL